MLQQLGLDGIVDTVNILASIIMTLVTRRNGISKPKRRHKIKRTKKLTRARRKVQAA
jgi:hypothetical protein